MPINTAIARKTLHDELLPRLNDMIIDGELDPGCRIPEEALCARFGVSRTPLREALKMLSVKGLVHLLPNKGSVVARITQQEAEELIPLLGTIEAHAAERACARVDLGGIARITELSSQLRENHRSGDEQTYLRTNRALHAAIIAAASNDILTQVYQLVEMRLCLLPVTRKLSPHWDEAIADHEDILEALHRRDGARLATILRDHVRHKAAVINKAFEAQKPQSPPKRRAFQ
jgi:DNA-binding GntR family transcriptional regulator